MRGSKHGIGLEAAADAAARLTKGKIMTPTCTRCPAPARWRDGDGRQFCGSHVPANGKPLARLPATPDILDRLDFVLNESEVMTIGRIGGGGGLFRVPCDVVEEAAAEIRRLRAELDKSGSC